MGRPLTLTGEVLSVCHGRKLSLLSLRPRGGREAWESFAGLIGPLPFPFHRWSTTHQTKRPPRGVGVLRRPDRPSFRQVNETLYRQGYATVHDLQLLRVDFNSNYEESPLQRRAARQRCVREETTQLRGVNRTPSPTSSCRSSSRCWRGAMPEAIRRLLRLHSQPPFTGDQDVPARSDAGEQRGRHPVGRGGGGHRAHQRAGAARGERHNQPGERLIIN